MKRIKYILLLIGLLYIPLIDVKASSASISCTSAGTVTVGNQITVTFTGNYSGSNNDMLMWRIGGINWDSSKLNANFNTPINFAEDGSFSKSFTFTATNVGTASVRLVNVDVTDGDQLIGPGGASNTCTINVVAPVTNSNSNQSSSNSSSSSSKNNIVNKNSDNNLKSLSVDGASLIPEFNKDTLEYNIELSNDTTKIKVNAEVNDSKANVSGIGEIEVKEGQNKLEIVVTAENGSTKTYIINAFVKEKDPIKVKVSGEEYTVVRKLDGLTIPQNFEEKDVIIGDETVKGCYNANINYTLVALKNSKGEINFFTYDLKKDTYSRYSMITSSTLSVVIAKVENEDEIPHRYYKSKFTYNNEEVDGYALSELSDFRVVYGINVETGEKRFYLYDMKENTIQRFYNDQVNIYVDLIKKCKLAFLTLGIFIILLTIVIVILLSKNVKFKKKYLNARLNPIDNPKYNEVKYQDLEGTRVMDKVDNKKKKDNKNKKMFLDE